MKTTIQKAIQTKYSNLAMVFFSLMILASCNKDSSNPAKNYADNGTLLCSKTFKLVTDLSSNERNCNYDKEFIKIMNDPSPETFNMKESSGVLPKLQSLYLGSAMISLEKVFTAYQLQLDSKISASNTNLNEKLIAACTALDSLEIGDALKAKNNSLKKGLGIGKYKVEGSIFQLTDTYAEIWDEMTKKYLAAQIDFQDGYANGIKSIPIGLFNTEMIKTKIDEPYNSSAVLVNLYKLKLIKENQDKLALLESRINNVSESFRLLLQIQGELIKRNQNRVKVKEMNSALEVLLAN